MNVQRHIINRAIVAYTVCFFVWRLLVASPLIERWWLLQLVEVFAVWALLPLPFLLVAGAKWRSGWLLAALLLPLFWFGHEYGRLFVPSLASTARANTEGTALRVMTFNTKALLDPEREFDATVEQLQPDVIVLQEVNSGFSRKFDELSETWPYHVRVSVRINGRIAILSKVPILSVVADDDWFGCHCVPALLDWNGKVIRVIVVHIRIPSIGIWSGRGILAGNGFDVSSQALTYNKLLPLIEASREPVIVLGDFNTTERQAGYKSMVAAGLKDAHEEAGWGLGMTFPTPFARFRWLSVSLIRIDHIFFDERWRAIKTWTTALVGSDHQALITDLRWVGDK